MGGPQRRAAHRAKAERRGGAVHGPRLERLGRVPPAVLRRIPRRPSLHDRPAGGQGRDRGLGETERTTPLHWAACFGKTAAARELLELGADASLRNQDGQTALETAEEEGEHETASCCVTLRRCGWGRGNAASPTPRCQPTRASASTRTATAPTRSLFGANAHFVRFDCDGQAEQPVELKGPAAAAARAGARAGAAAAATAARGGRARQPALGPGRRGRRVHGLRGRHFLAARAAAPLPLLRVAGVQRLLRREDATGARAGLGGAAQRAGDAVGAAGVGVAAAQLEPEPEPEPAAVAEAVPVLPLHARNLQLQGGLRRRGGS